MNLYAPKREETVESYLLQRCRAAGLLCLKFTSPARRGVPDRVVIGPESGRTTFVELKRPGSQARRSQREMHAKMRRYGAEIRVIDDEKDVDALIAQLRPAQTTPAPGGRRR